jgi:hypothetical protein
LAISQFHPEVQDECASHLPGWHPSQHRFVVLQVEWDKGHALAHLLGALGLDGADDVLPIYIGDDRWGVSHPLRILLEAGNDSSQQTGANAHTLTLQCAAAVQD